MKCRPAQGLMVLSKKIQHITSANESRTTPSPKRERPTLTKQENPTYNQRERKQNRPKPQARAAHPPKPAQAKPPPPPTPSASGPNIRPHNPITAARSSLTVSGSTRAFSIPSSR